MVKLRIKVGAKGQIVIPKILREAYGIKENGYVIIEPKDNVLLIRRIENPEKILEWIRERRKHIGGKEARLGDLIKASLEEEFNEDIY